MRSTRRGTPCSFFPSPKPACADPPPLRKNNSVYKGPKAKGQQQQQQQQQPKPTPPTPTPAPAPVPTVAPTPSTPAGSVAPPAEGPTNKRARDDAVEADAAGKKKAKKDKKKEVAPPAAAAEGASEVDATGEDIEVEGAAGSTKAAKKASKKQKQKDRLDALAAPEPDAPMDESVLDPSLREADIPVVAAPAALLPVDIPTLAAAVLASSSASLLPPSPSTTAPRTIHAFLATLLPTLLPESRSLAALRAVVVAQAADAGFADEKEVEKVLWEGVWVGGPKPKKMVSLNFERADRAKGKGKAGKVEPK